MSTLVQLEQKRHFIQGEVAAGYIGEIGWGLFAETDFAIGDCVCWLYLGQNAHSHIRPWHDSFGLYFDRSFTVAPDFAWCASPEHPFWYINHSCRANCGFVNWGRAEHGFIPIVAYQPIARGEQITLDYALFTCSYDGSPAGDPWGMSPCLCHEPNCRGVITAFDRLPPDLQLQAALPDNGLYGCVLAHMLPGMFSFLNSVRQASLIAYTNYLDVFQQQLALSARFHRETWQKLPLATRFNRTDPAAGSLLLPTANGY